MSKNLLLSQQPISPKETYLWEFRDSDSDLESSETEDNNNDNSSKFMESDIEVRLHWGSGALVQREASSSSSLPEAIIERAKHSWRIARNNSINPSHRTYSFLQDGWDIVIRVPLQGAKSDDNNNKAKAHIVKLIAPDGKSFDAINEKQDARKYAIMNGNHNLETDNDNRTKEDADKEEDKISPAKTYLWELKDSDSDLESSETDDKNTDNNASKFLDKDVEVRLQWGSGELVQSSQASSRPQATIQQAKYSWSRARESITAHDPKKRFWSFLPDSWDVVLLVPPQRRRTSRRKTRIIKLIAPDGKSFHAKTEKKDAMEYVEHPRAFIERNNNEAAPEEKRKGPLHHLDHVRLNWATGSLNPESRLLPQSCIAAAVEHYNRIRDSHKYADVNEWLPSDWDVLIANDVRGCRLYKYVCPCGQSFYHRDKAKKHALDRIINADCCGRDGDSDGGDRDEIDEEQEMAATASIPSTVVLESENDDDDEIGEEADSPESNRRKRQKLTGSRRRKPSKDKIERWNR